ncbi:uncharacterized protein LOC132714899 [Ruditapes philippinarum]|uniref:uncharacterized protein LOC132714899 n=1 Tax=Ruditapes philippinarum TaxID=129788 RepID=UPI00295B5F65|nr:uncharacterized protein LOC132714899 [Ruditapes philippinarum]
MASLLWILPVFVLSFALCFGQDLYGMDGCPEAQCQNKPYIPPDCRKNQFTIGSDGKTRCRTCDASFCDPGGCPLASCPDLNITKECRKPSFVIGLDGITKCRMCDSNACGDPKIVCPKIKCPTQPPIPANCVEKQFTIGSDGITLCPACDKKNCPGGQNENQNY